MKGSFDTQRGHDSVAKILVSLKKHRNIMGVCFHFNPRCGIWAVHSSWDLLHAVAGV